MDSLKPELRPGAYEDKKLIFNIPFQEVLWLTSRLEIEIFHSDLQGR